MRALQREREREFICCSNTSVMCQGGTNHWCPVVLPHIFWLSHSLIVTASFSEILAIVSDVAFSCEHLVEACWRNLAAPIVTSTVHFWTSLQVMLVWYFLFLFLLLVVCCDTFWEQNCIHISNKIMCVVAKTWVQQVGNKILHPASRKWWQKWGLGHLWWSQ